MRKDCEGCAYLRGFGYCIYNGECTDLDSWTDILDVTKMADIDDYKKLPESTICCYEISKYGKHSHSPETEIVYVDEPNRIVGERGGLKNDANKLDWTMLPFEAIEEILKIMDYGAKKYERDNWKKVEPNRYIAALFRHIVAEIKGEDYDKESGRLHLSHAACCILFLLYLKMKEVGIINEKNKIG